MVCADTPRSEPVILTWIPTWPGGTVVTPQAHDEAPATKMSGRSMLRISFMEAPFRKGWKVLRDVFDRLRSMAAVRGFEPRFATSKAAVLPLDDTAMVCVGSC